MTLKELCAQTGLTKKTIRFYEEKGLISPRTETRNGRSYRNYTRAELHRLQTIATLRKARFTIEEIHRMLEDPATIREIFPQYRLWLRQQKQEVDALLSAAEQTDPEHLTTMEALTAALTAAATPLPLPETDIRPRFRYLDELEERPRELPPADPRDKSFAGDKVHRQMTVLASQDPRDDVLLKTGLMTDTASMLKNRDSGPVTGKKLEKEPLWLRVLSLILSLLLTFSVGALLLSYILFRPDSTLWGPFVLTLLLRGGLQLYKYSREQKAWRARMGQTRQERGWKALEPKTRKIILGSIAGVLVLAAGIALLAISQKNAILPDARIAVVYEEGEHNVFPEKALTAIEGAFRYKVDDRRRDGVAVYEITVISPAEYDPAQYDVVFVSAASGSPAPLTGLAEPPTEYREECAPYLSYDDAEFLEGSHFPGDCFVGVSSALSPEEQAEFFAILSGLKTTFVPPIYKQGDWARPIGVVGN